jgi:hypothetical protein
MLLKINLYDRDVPRQITASFPESKSHYFLSLEFFNDFGLARRAW